MQTIRVTQLLVLVLTCLFCVAAAASITIPVSKDAQLTYQSKACPYPTCTNQGSSDSIVIGNTEITSEGLFGFDLSSIPASSRIVSARLQLPAGSSPFGTQESTLSVFKITDNAVWSESTVVWDSKPAFDSPAIGTSSFVMPGPASPLDVTAATKSGFSSSSKSVGFRVIASLNVFLNSKESSSGGATLIVQYESGSSGNACNCTSGRECCGTQCFNPSSYVCSDGILCPVGTTRCGTSNICYDPVKYNCTQPGNRLCPSKTVPCGPSCIDSAVYSCCNNQVVRAGTRCQ